MLTKVRRPLSWVEASGAKLGTGAFSTAEEKVWGRSIARESGAKAAPFQAAAGSIIMARRKIGCQMISGFSVSENMPEKG